METSCHIAVLEREVVDYIGAHEGGSFLDCTLGGAGHTRAILEANAKNTVCAIDRDQNAIERASALVSHYQGRLEIKHADFIQLTECFAERKFDGILADLGVSSDQLAEERGFSFEDQTDLDMRMDQSQELKASDLIANLSQRELVTLLRRGGAEQEAFIAAKIMVENRPFQSAKALAQMLNQALRTKFINKRTQPATVVFQALRIAVNQEIEQIESLLSAAPELAKPQARLVIIGFHSLEDRIVTQQLRKWSSAEFSASSPSAQHVKPIGKLLTKKGVTANDRELERNARARSAKLRAFQFN